MSYSASGILPTQIPSRTVTVALLGMAIAVVDSTVALLVVPIPAILLLAPLLVPADQIDLGVALIDTTREAWLAAIPGALLVLAIGVVGAKVIRRQRAWIVGRVTPTPTVSVEPEPGSTAGLAQFTERELQVLGLMSRGLTNGAIGQELFISESTVRKHVGRIFAKLGLDADCDNDRRVTAVLAYVQFSG